MEESQRPKGRKIRIDDDAESANPELPAFLARPEGAPSYHGFPLTEIEVEGFKLGAITDFVGSEAGDGFVVAPDGSRAGLVWQIADEEIFVETLPPDAGRWGVWEVSFSAVMQNENEVRDNFAALVPKLRDRWNSWAKRAGKTSP